jgi:hypothetical protein
MLTGAVPHEKFAHLLARKLSQAKSKALTAVFLQSMSLLEFRDHEQSTVDADTKINESQAVGAPFWT